MSDAVQAAYDDGSLFSLGGDLATLSAPEPLAPEAGADLTRADTIDRSRGRPSPAPRATSSAWGPSPEALRSEAVTGETSLGIAVSRLATSPTGTQGGILARGSHSPTAQRELRRRCGPCIVFRGGPLVLASGAPAYVEVANGDGTDPCGPGAESPDGCDEVGGNLVYHSLNSTGAYYFSEAPGTQGSEAVSFGTMRPNDFEIRFTEEGSLAGYLFRAPYNVVRVPFEVWDVGVRRAGRGPTTRRDDIRLVPFLLADDGGDCAFDPAEIPDGEATLPGYVESDRIYAYYPATSYADFESAFASEVASAPEDCFASGDQEALGAFIARTRPSSARSSARCATAPALPPTAPSSGCTPRTRRPSPTSPRPSLWRARARASARTPRGARRRCGCAGLARGRPRPRARRAGPRGRGAGGGATGLWRARVRAAGRAGLWRVRRGGVGGGEAGDAARDGRALSRASGGRSAEAPRRSPLAAVRRLRSTSSR